MRPYNSLASLRRNPIGILFVIVLLQASILSYLSIMKHYAFMTTAWDLGIYEQVIWSTVNTGRIFWYTVEIVINPSCNFLGIHFSPFLFLVLPAYAISQTTETLLTLQAFFLALGAVPLYKLVAYERGSYKQALVFASIYLAYPPVVGVALFDFHVQAFLPFLFFSAFYYFRKEEWGKYFFFIILSLMNIEFVPLIVIFFGFYGLWTNKKKILRLIRIFNLKRLLLTKTVLVSIITIILGFAWFIVARSLISSTNPSAPPHPNWAASGDPVHNLPGFIFNVLTNPIRTLEIIFTSADQKALYIFGLLAALAFLPILDLPSLMIGAPWFFVVFLSSYPPYYTSTGYQYVAFVVPFVFISAVCGVKHLSHIRQRVSSCRRFAVLFERRIIIHHMRALKIFFLVFAVAMSFIIALISYSGFLGSISVPTITEHDRIAKAFTELIPSNASILTQNDLFPHLSKRLYGYVGGEFSQHLPQNLIFDYILIDTTSTWYEDPLRNLISNLTRDGIFGIQYAADGVWLLKRNYTGKTMYPIRNGVFMNFYNQGVLMKVFNHTSFDSEPLYKGLQLSISFSQGSNTSQSWTANNFSALEFEGWLYIPVSGDYSFRLEKTGSSSLYLDGSKILYDDGSDLYRVEALDCVQRLERGFHQIKVEYIPEKLLAPSVRLLWKPPWETNTTDVQSAFIYPCILPEASSPFLNLNWNFGSRSPFPLVNEDYFGGFANGTIYASFPGRYKFKVAVDGYAFFSVDGKSVPQVSNSTQSEFEFLLTEGHHVFEVDYMAIQGDAKLSVLWKTPASDGFEEIPLNNLNWQGN